MEETKLNEQKKVTEYSRNFFVFLALAALTAIEFLVAINLEQATVPLRNNFV